MSDGSKTFISDGPHGNLVVVAKTDPDNAGKGISLIVVETDGLEGSAGAGCSTQMQCDIADERLQFFGGYGCLAEYPISRLYTDARIQRIYVARTRSSRAPSGHLGCLEGVR